MPEMTKEVYSVVGKTCNACGKDFEAGDTVEQTIRGKITARPFDANQPFCIDDDMDSAAVIVERHADRCPDVNCNKVD